MGRLPSFVAGFMVMRFPYLGFVTGILSLVTHQMSLFQSSAPMLGLIVVHDETGVDDAGDPTQECQQET